MPNSNLERGLIKKIHHSAVLVDGKKYFGKYDTLVETGSCTTTFQFNPGKPETTIIISAMERPRRLRETFRRILLATQKYDIATRILIMDNSIINHIKDLIPHWSLKMVGNSIESIVHHHDPRMTQTTGRNVAVKYLIGDAKDLFLWDGDIYCNNKCLASLGSEWNKNPNLTAIAPVLIGYLSGNIDDRISEFSDIATNSETRAKTHMPGKIGEQIWIREGNLMRATMMRGAFGVKRTLVDAVASSNPDGKPWLQDFVSLNNVAFFVAARELGNDFAYLLDPNAIAAHNDNVDFYSVGFKLPMRETQTLMEITALMVRNLVFTSEGMDANPRFLNFNISEISRAAVVSESTARLIQYHLLILAELINKSRDQNDFRDGYDQKSVHIPHDIKIIVDRVFERIYSGNSFQRIKELRSPKPLRTMYSVED